MAKAINIKLAQCPPRPILGGLEDLWHLVKRFHYPINDKEQLERLLGNFRLHLKHDEFDARDISLQILEYPIHRPSDVIGFFLREQLNYNEADGKLIRLIFK